MTIQYLTIKPDCAYGASINGHHYSEYFTDDELAGVAQTFARFQNYSHGQIAVDAGGTISEHNTNRFGDVEIVSVTVDKLSFISHCNRLRAAESNPRDGMMVTSTGEWVSPDDWDIIESNI